MERRLREYLLILFFAVLSLFALSAKAQVITGADYLAARHGQFPAETALDVFSFVDIAAVGFLWGTFGSDPEMTSEFLRICDQRMPPATLGCLMRIHFQNGSCRRLRRCLWGELMPELSVGDFNKRVERKNRHVMLKIRRRAAAIARFVERNRYRATFLVSTSLEDNYSLKTYRTILNELRSILPPEVMVGRNPENSHSRNILDGDFIELHGVLSADTFAGSPAGAFKIFCNDGNDLYLGSGRPPRGGVPVSDMYRAIRANRENVDLVLYWKAEWQGITGPEFISPLERTPRVNPADIAVLNRLIRRNENAD